MLTLTDLFCGAGGSSTGAAGVPGVRVRMAANHWQLAVDTHNTNHPDADHSCADLSQVDPRYFPRTDLLWASPECTNHSQAKGKKRASAQLDLLDEAPLPDEAAERSRATMWDVVRFTEHHRYAAVMVENVVDAIAWLPFRAWLMAMDSLGYEHQLVFLNSMHAQHAGLPAPQSRDRMYVVFHRKGNPRPDLPGHQRPRAWCPVCEEEVRAVQSWKNPAKAAGRYRQQYVYRCPNVSCRNTVVEPGWLPAASIIDWSLPGQRIGDRARPLADKTRTRIAAGIARHWGQLHIEAAGHTYDSTNPRHPAHGRPDGYVRAWPTTDPVRSVHTTPSKALVVPAGGTWNDVAHPADLPMRTRTTRETDALVVPLRTHGTATPAEEPTKTCTAGTVGQALVRPPLVAELRGGGSTSRLASDPLCTVTAGGNHHGLVTSYYGKGTPSTTEHAVPTVTTVEKHALVMRNNTARGDSGQMTTPAREVFRTFTTTGGQSLLTPGDLAAAAAQVDDVLFRMFEPSEVIAAMAFPSDYTVLGNRREQVRMAGNAVTPPAARDIVTAVAATLQEAS